MSVNNYAYSLEFFRTFDKTVFNSKINSKWLKDKYKFGKCFLIKENKIFYLMLKK